MPSPAQPRPSILSIEPYVGGESTVPGVNRIVKLSSNEGAFGPPPSAIEAMAAAAREMHRYPDGHATALREAIGRRFGLDPARIVCGNGSDEIIQHLILAYGGEGTELVMSAHGFVMYDISGRYAGCRVIKVPEWNLVADVDAMLAAVGPRTKLVFLANPNNPTGSMLPAAEVARHVARPGVHHVAPDLQPGMGRDRGPRALEPAEPLRALAEELREPVEHEADLFARGGDEEGPAGRRLAQRAEDADRHRVRFAPPPSAGEHAGTGAAEQEFPLSGMGRPDGGEGVEKVIHVLYVLEKGENRRNG